MRHLRVWGFAALGLHSSAGEADVWVPQLEHGCWDLGWGSMLRFRFLTGVSFQWVGAGSAFLALILTNRKSSVPMYLGPGIGLNPNSRP